MTAGLYCSRARLHTLVLERNIFGGQVAVTSHIENYPGFPCIAGAELARQMQECAFRFGATARIAEATSLSRQDNGRFLLQTSVGTVQAKAIIVATGGQHRLLGVPGEKEFFSQGVSYCAVCDGPFYEGAQVVVVGGGDSAIQEAIYLTQYAEKVTVVHRRQGLRASKLLEDEARRNSKIAWALGRVVTEIRGHDMVEEVLVKDVASGREEAISAEGVFIYVGMLPNTKFLQGLVALATDGFLLTGEAMRTSVPGIFAAGDVRHKEVRQIATAVGDGAQAALAAVDYVRHLEG